MATTFGQTFLRLLRNWKLITFRKLLYFPRIFSTGEKRILLFLVIAALISGGWFSLRLIQKITVIMPEVGEAYSEGMQGEPHLVNPILAARDVDRDIARFVFSGLFAYDQNGAITNDLAQTLNLGGDAKTYTVTIKKNAFWHDGVRVTADDVVFTVQAIQNPRYKSPLRPNWQGVTVEELDPETLVFTLRTSYAPFIENLTLGILPKHLWQNVLPENVPLHELNIKPIGSGPYRFDKFKQTKDGAILWYRLKRNPTYHREGPYLKTMTFFFFKNEEEILEALRKGRIEGYGPVSEKNLPLLQDERVSILNLRMPRIFGIFFNQQRAPSLGDKKVREAIAHAIDNQKLARSITLGGAIPYDFPLPPLRGAASQGNEAYSYDPNRAKKLLEEAGWKDRNGDGIREKSAKKKRKEEVTVLKFTLTTSDWPDLIMASELLKGMFKEIGIDLTIEIKPFAELESLTIRPRKFDMLLFGQVYGYEPDPFPFWHSTQVKDPGLNIALLVDKKIDRLLEEARRTTDVDLRNKKYEEFQKLIVADIPAIFLYSQLYFYAAPSDIKGIDITRISLPADRFNEVHRWYRDTKWVLK